MNTRIICYEDDIHVVDNLAGLKINAAKVIMCVIFTAFQCMFVRLLACVHPHAFVCV